MEPTGPCGAAAVSAGMPGDVLIVEDDAIIALDFEDTLARFGIASVRIASNVTQALAMIAERVPDFALLDIGL
ncbi:MAG: response regulator, partial [Proteobacteria bacterium]|nr:response regulator [Pseudomonadota bacterium]